MLGWFWDDIFRQKLPNWQAYIVIQLSSQNGDIEMWHYFVRADICVWCHSSIHKVTPTYSSVLR